MGDVPIGLNWTLGKRAHIDRLGLISVYSCTIGWDGPYEELVGAGCELVQFICIYKRVEFVGV